MTIGARGRRSLVTTLVALLVAALLVLAFRAAFERVDEEIDVGYSGEARINPFRALELLLVDQGFEARTARAEWSLPGKDAALLLFGPRRTLASERVSEVLAWVGQGGRLVVTPAGDVPADRLHVVDFETGGGKAKPKPDPAPTPTAEEREEDEPEKPGEEKVVADPILELFGVGTAWRRPERTSVAVLPEGERLRLAFGSGRRLVVSREGGAFVAGDRTAAVLVRYPYGKGSVTVLADASCLVNRRIGLDQHPDLALSLLADVEGEVVIVFRDDMPPLALLLVTKGWAATLTLVALLLSWAWSSGSRFGPLLSAPEGGRRSLREHLLASGRFVLQSGRPADLLAATRAALSERLTSRKPEWTRLAHRELVRRLAQEAGLPHARVDRALSGDASEGERLTQTIQTLEILRRAL